MRLWALLTKEWRLLYRDIHALVVLFIMPLIFVLLMAFALSDLNTGTTAPANLHLLQQADDTNSRFFAAALADIVGTDKAKQALLEVPFYFAGQNHPKVTNNWGDISTNKKTNAVGKSDSEACQWVLLSAIKALQEAAQKRGYDAVVNIRSNYKNNEFSSATEYNCGAGRIMAGVALKGELVKF